MLNPKEWMSKKFTLCGSAFAVGATFIGMGIIPPDSWDNLLMWTVGPYAAANGIEKAVGIWAASRAK